MVEWHSKVDDIAYFLSFCIELYRNNNNISGQNAYETLSDTGALNYLESNYEVIHTQGPEWILKDINEYVRLHKS